VAQQPPCQVSFSARCTARDRAPTHR